MKKYFRVQYIFNERGKWNILFNSHSTECRQAKYTKKNGNMLFLHEKCDRTVMSKYAKKVETDIGVTAYEVYKPKMSKNNWKQNGFHREYDLKGVRLIRFPQNISLTC